MQSVRFYAGLIIGTVLTLFALQNLQTTQVRILLWFVDLPLVAIIFGSAAVGALWAALWIALVRWRHRRRIAGEPSPPDSDIFTPPPT
ncbi:MAG TPA: LapA family protein [Steroidobacteraceae bacterium]|nr:LapA family protein [Steroidobacteraceae bacterium]HRX89416.1 LapA family protein [Steroidobacteraceae bacterium]